MLYKFCNWVFKGNYIFNFAKAQRRALAGIVDIEELARSLVFFVEEVCESDQQGSPYLLQ